MASQTTSALNTRCSHHPSRINTVLTCPSETGHRPTNSWCHRAPPLMTRTPMQAPRKSNHIVLPKYRRRLSINRPTEARPLTTTSRQLCTRRPTCYLSSIIRQRLHKSLQPTTHISHHQAPQTKTSAAASCRVKQKRNRNQWHSVM